MDQELRSAQGLVALMGIPRIGRRRALRLSARYDSYSQLQADVETASALAGTTLELPPTLRAVDLGASDGVRVIGFYDPEYPAPLRETPDPPAVLWVRGSLPAPTSVAVVGTRAPSPAGLRGTHRVVQALASLRRGVTSGLAFGVDIAAHRASLELDLPTWAVLGSGVDNPTPGAHIRDVERILAGGGGLVSEVPLGTQPSPASLLARNRLQAAFSAATVVAECGIPSGTLTTAKDALAAGRPLLTLDLPAAGNRALLSETSHPDLKPHRRFCPTGPLASVLDPEHAPALEQLLSVRPTTGAGAGPTASPAASLPVQLDLF